MSAAKGRGRKKRGGDHEGGHADERWLISYADMITLLMALFVVMWSMANVNTSKFEALSVSLKEAFSGRILDGGERIMQPGSSSADQRPAPQPPIPTIAPVTSSAEGDGQRTDAADIEDAELRKLEREIDEWVEARGMAKEVQTDIERRGLVVRVLTDRILFDSGSAELKPGADPLLDALARLLKSTVRNPIQVEGNTDNVPVSGRFPTNWELSTSRATTVVRGLIARGVGPGRLAATGYADRHPIASNATDAGRRRNRRVELVVLRIKGHGGQAGTQGGPGR
jgi:chemotaxis protein MotB